VIGKFKVWVRGFLAWWNPWTLHDQINRLSSNYANLVTYHQNYRGRAKATANAFAQQSYVAGVEETGTFPDAITLSDDPEYLVKFPMDNFDKIWEDGTNAE
jgi:hypothetical protein